MKMVGRNESFYKCGMCGFSASKKTNLEIHIRKEHTGEKPYKCLSPNCSFETMTAQNLRGHQFRIYESLRSFPCDLCPYKATKNSTLLLHKRTHTKEKPFSCSVADCKYQTWTAFVLKLYKIRFHGRKRPHPCPENGCSYRAKDRGGLSKHLQNHNLEKKLKCPHPNCPYRCNQHHSMKSHVRTHTGETPYICKLCPYRGKTAGSLRTHMVIHTGEKIHNCDLCEFSSGHRASLVLHLRTHRQEKPFKCKVKGCGYTSKQRSNLRTHENGVHSKEKRFHCTFCEYKTTSSLSLNIHVRSHTGEKPFNCKLCDYSSSQVTHLRTHERSLQRNVNFGKYKCPLCSYVSRKGSKRKLKIHIMKKHEGKYQCKKCEFKCRLENGLKIHVSKMHGQTGKNTKRMNGKERILCKCCEFSTDSVKELVLHENRIHK